MPLARVDANPAEFRDLQFFFQRNLYVSLMNICVSVSSNLRVIFRPKKGEEKRERRKLHKEEFRDLFSLKNVIRVVRSRVKRWAHAWERRQLHVKICTESCRVGALGREQIQLLQDGENWGMFQNMIMICWLLQKRNMLD